MTNPTTRQVIADAAQRAGWTRTIGHLSDRYRRAGVRIDVEHGHGGGVLRAERWSAAGTITGFATRRDAGKRETVLGWLQEPAADEPAAPAAPLTPMERDTADLEARVAALDERPAVGTGTPAENPSQSAREAVHLLAVGAVEHDGLEHVARLEDEVVQYLAALEARVDELERRGRRMVQTLVQQRDGNPGQPILSISASRAFGLLADAVGADIPPAPRAGLEAGLVLVDEVVPSVVGADEPSTVREALALDGREALPRLIAGEDVQLREAVRPEYGARPGPMAMRHRVYGALYKRPDGQEVLLVADGRHDVVPLDLVLPYLAAVRGAGFPAPTRRVALLEAVRAAHRR